MKPGESKADKQVVKDEADATVREGARQAAAEHERALMFASSAAEEARIAAAAEDTAPAATKTFWQRFKDRMSGYP